MNDRKLINKYMSQLHDLVGEENLASQLPWKFQAVQADAYKDESGKAWLATLDSLKTGVVVSPSSTIKIVRTADALPLTLIKGLSISVDKTEAKSLTELLTQKLTLKLLQTPGATNLANIVTTVTTSTGSTFLKFLDTMGLTIQDAVEAAPEFSEILSIITDEYMFVSMTDPVYNNIEGYEVTPTEATSISNSKIGLAALWVSAKARTKAAAARNQWKLRNYNPNAGEGDQGTNTIIPPFKFRYEKGDVEIDQTVTSALFLNKAIKAKNRMSMLAVTPQSKVLNIIRHAFQVIADNPVPGFIGQISFLYALAIEESALTPGIREVLASGGPGPSQGLWQIQDRYAKYKLPSYDASTAKVYSVLEAKNALYYINAQFTAITNTFDNAYGAEGPSLTVKPNLNPVLKQQALLTLKQMRKELGGNLDGAMEVWFLMATAWGIGRIFTPQKGRNLRYYDAQAGMRQAVVYGAAYAYHERLPVLLQLYK